MPVKPNPSKRPPGRKFDTPEEGAQAKADYVWNTVLKNVDWDKLEQLREKR